MQGKPLHEAGSWSVAPRSASAATPRLCYHNHPRLHYSELFRKSKGNEGHGPLGEDRATGKRCPAATGHLIDSIGLGVENILRRGREGWYRKARPPREVLPASLAMYHRIDWTSSNKSYVSEAYVPRKITVHLPMAGLRDLCALDPRRGDEETCTHILEAWLPGEGVEGRGSRISIFIYINQRIPNSDVPFHSPCCRILDSKSRYACLASTLVV